MISTRHADLLETLKNSKPTLFHVKLRYENNILEITNIAPENSEYFSYTFERRDYLDKTIMRCGGLPVRLGGNPQAKILKIIREIERLNDTRLSVHPDHVISENANKDRFSFDVTVK